MGTGEGGQNDKVVTSRGWKEGEMVEEKEEVKKRMAGLLNGVRDKKQIRFTHSRFPLANSISSGLPLTLCS
ncbi:hypothetical protein HZH68_012232 [Vespula germanica]|uniref:Uncharacterized protein n=1 Tax=Vespula germanica TaxID=30212 RepID=A0A834MWX1_VESGE|nr:hypothetical protein HZH68_012232 [Vespula germanica]